MGYVAILYWFRRPPYLRWLAAAVVVVVAVAFELKPDNAEPHPFAAGTIEKGQPVTDIEWRSVPAGLMPLPDLAGARAAARLAQGEPILPSDISHRTTLPAGWWTLPLELPTLAPPGAEARLVLVASSGDPVQTVPGVVVSSAPSDGLSAKGPIGMVAVPEEMTVAVATASAAGQIVVLLKP